MVPYPLYSTHTVCTVCMVLHILWSRTKVKPKVYREWVDSPVFSWAPLLWVMSSSTEKAVQTLQKKSQKHFFVLKLQFISCQGKKSAHPLQANVCISRRIKGRETPNNWVVCRCSVVYLTRGIGIFVGTSSKWWDPECPLHCVMHASTVYSANTLHPPTSLPECGVWL